MKPAEIVKEFPRKRFGGCDAAAVRRHLVAVAALVGERDKRIQALEAEVESLKGELGQRYRHEHTISDALLQAQEVGARIKKDAEEEAEAIRNTASAQAERILEVARAEAEARRARAVADAEEAERRRVETRRILAETVARAGAALKGGLEGVLQMERWLLGEDGPVGVEEKAGSEEVLHEDSVSGEKRGLSVEEFAAAGYEESAERGIGHDSDA